MIGNDEIIRFRSDYWPFRANGSTAVCLPSLSTAPETTSHFTSVHLVYTPPFNPPPHRFYTSLIHFHPNLSFSLTLSAKTHTDIHYTTYTCLIFHTFLTHAPVLLFGCLGLATRVDVSMAHSGCLCHYPCQNCTG
jgi:hypothetical protein